MFRHLLTMILGEMVRQHQLAGEAKYRVRATQLVTFKRSGMRLHVAVSPGPGLETDSEKGTPWSAALVYGITVELS